MPSTPAVGNTPAEVTKPYAAAPGETKAFTASAPLLPFPPDEHAVGVPPKPAPWLGSPIDPA
jgi:hypothetical protein